jgi:hypothetical protein
MPDRNIPAEPKDTEMKRHYVTFMSPGTFMAESSTKQVESWDVEAAKKMAEGIEERHAAIPYCFYFSTQERGAAEWEPKQTAKSPTYYLPHCKIETLEEIEARNDPKEKILRSNMRGNGWNRVVVTTKGWRWTQPLNDDDVVLK